MKKEKESQIVSIIDDCNDLTLATVRPDGYPQATTVSYVNDGLTIYFGTSTESQKARNISENASVSLTINRPYESWDDIEGVSISGMATAIHDAEKQEKVGELLFSKFPQIVDYMPSNTEPDQLVLYEIRPQYVSLLDYKKGFGHTELITL